jgi:hypothetical protein
MNNPGRLSVGTRLVSGTAAAALLEIGDRTVLGNARTPWLDRAMHGFRGD